MRIMVPLDGSPRSEFALGSAAYLARHTSPPAELILLHVVDLTPVAMAGIMPTYGEMVTQAIETGNDYLRGIALRDSLAKLKVIQRTVAGTLSISKTILTEARELNAELIVISSSGRTGLAEMALGSVAHELARMSDIPVMIQHLEESFDRPFDFHQPFTALVALDGSKNAEAVVPMAVEITQALRGKVRLLSVLPSQSGDRQGDTAAMDAMEAYLRDMQLRLQHMGVPAEISLAWGDPAEQIIHKAQARPSGCDLVILATHGRTGMERLMMGSVAERVVRNVHCPLLIVRPRG
jgi:nucleotide-binding universal stress UspA family protein